MRNYIFIAVTFIVIFALSVGYLIGQQITNTKPDYDAGIAAYEGNIASGIVSGTSYIVDHPQFENRFQYTAPTQRGNSGGPVFDNTGNVIGVYTGQIADFEKIFAKEPSIGDWIPETINLAQNINFAIKVNVVVDFLNKTLGKVPLPEKPIPLEEEDLYTKAKNFTVPVVCFKNKAEPPVEVQEIRIGELGQ